MALERAHPGKELFFRELVRAARLLDRDLAVTYCGDHCCFATDNPSFCVRMRQTIHGRPARRPVGERFHRAPRGAGGPSPHRQDPPVNRSSRRDSGISPGSLYYRANPRIGTVPVYFTIFSRVLVRCHQFFFIFSKRVKRPSKDRDSARRPSDDRIEINRFVATHYLSTEGLIQPRKIGLIVRVKRHAANRCSKACPPTIGRMQAPCRDWHVE